MSNPAVIILSDSSGRNLPFKRFVLEDNIGESIHLHIDNMRMDFTINEFIEFSKMIRSSIDELDILKGYKLGSFDEYFLKECSIFLKNLQSIVVRRRKITDLKCIVHTQMRKGLVLQRLLPVSQTPAYKYLDGEGDSFNEYVQFNYFGINNEQRLVKILDSIKSNGYPLNDSHIITFYGQDVVRDGQHRLAVLAHVYGVDHMIDVQEFKFSGTRHKINVHKNNIKCITIWAVRKTYGLIKSIFK